MIEIRAASDREAADWLVGWKQRIRSWYARVDAPDGWLAEQVERRTTIPDGAEWHPRVLTEDGAPVGILTTRLAPYGPATIAGVVDIWVSPAHRCQGIGTSARQWAEDWARSQGRPILVTTDPANEAAVTLFRTYPVRFQSMLKRLRPAAAGLGELVPRPMREREFEDLVENATRAFADHTAASGLLSPDDAIRRARSQFGAQRSDGLATKGSSFWTLADGPDPVATLWLRHSSSPEVSFVGHVQVYEGFRGRGYGRAAMLVAERISIDAGDGYLGLSVFGRNAVAVRLYTRLGYATVDQGRSVGAA